MSNPTTRYRPASPIPYGRQTLDDTDIQAVIDTLKSPFLTQGPAIERFEKAVADYCGVAYAVAFASGTAALHGACFAAGIGPGDEVITSPNTFVASSNSVLYADGTPVFADINPTSWNLDVEKARAAITPKTKALMPVHFSGQPVDLDAFYALADEHNLIVIEDGAHALGAHYHGKPIGQCRDMTMFSFHPVKSVTTGEGGVIVTPHRHLYEKLLTFRTHGITKDTGRYEVFEPAPWVYEMQELGYHYRMTDIQAALGESQMKKLDNFITARNRITDRYRQAFSACPAITVQSQLTDTHSADHLFVIHLNPEQTSVSRRELFDKLLAADIRPQVHYIPVHLQPYYQNHLGTRQGQFPNVEAYYEGCLSLPVYPSLSQDDQDYIIETVLDALT